MLRSKVRKLLFLQLRRWSSFNIAVSEEVQSALERNCPVVALETTIITHGMPYPSNVTTALKVESIVRRHGAIPAAIGVLNGKIKVGLSKDEIEFLAEKRSSVVKISRRDIPYVVSRGLSGGTTVAGTMVIAEKVGIKIFATGGVGGVHRGAETSLDISADLRELGRTPITVVSAGIKSILDIEKTLEYLETEGVTVATYVQDPTLNSGDFPAFFTPRSGIKSPCILNTLGQAVDLVLAHRSLGLQNGMMVAVPAPESNDGETIERAIRAALAEAFAKQVKGKDITPFVLALVNEKTKGLSLQINQKLIENNAAVASQIAVEVAARQQQKSRKGDHSHKVDATGQKCVVVGATVVDVSLSMQCETFSMDGSTYPAKVTRSAGGVGRNLARGLRLFGQDVCLISAIGSDNDAKFLMEQDSNIVSPAVRTVKCASSASMYIVFNNQGTPLVLFGDEEVIKLIDAEHISKNSEVLKTAPLVMVDACLTESSLDHIFKLCTEAGVPVWFEPTDPNLCHKLASVAIRNRKCLTYCSPNVAELQVMVTAFGGREKTSSIAEEQLQAMELRDVISLCENLGKQILKHAFQHVFVTLGPHGVLLISTTRATLLGPDAIFNDQYLEGNQDYVVTHFQAPQMSQEQIVNFSGAGDSFAAGVACGILRYKPLEECVRIGLEAAKLSLMSCEAISDKITNIAK